MRNFGPVDSTYVRPIMGLVSHCPPKAIHPGRIGHVGDPVNLDLPRHFVHGGSSSKESPGLGRDCSTLAGVTKLAFSHRYEFRMIGFATQSPLLTRCRWTGHLSVFPSGNMRQGSGVERACRTFRRRCGDGSQKEDQKKGIPVGICGRFRDEWKREDRWFWTNNGDSAGPL